MVELSAGIASHLFVAQTRSSQVRLQGVMMFYHGITGRFSLMVAGQDFD